MKTVGYFIVLLTIMLLASLSFKTASAASFQINVTSLPFSSEQEVTITLPAEDLPSIINITYEGFLSGIEQITLANSTFAKVNVSMNVPENASDGNYEWLATFVSDKGKRLQVGFNFAVTAGKIAAVTNITTSCQNVIIGNVTRLVCDISSVGQEQKPEVITQYNITPVIACSDYYQDDYQSLSNENLNLKNKIEKVDADYKNFTKLILRGCSDEQLEFNNCLKQKAVKEQRDNIRLGDDFCAQQNSNLNVCLKNKADIEKQATAGLNVTAKRNFYIVLAALIVVIAVDVLAAILPKLLKRKRRF